MKSKIFIGLLLVLVLGGGLAAVSKVSAERCQKLRADNTGSLSEWDQVEAVLKQNEVEADNLPAGSGKKKIARWARSGSGWIVRSSESVILNSSMPFCSPGRKTASWTSGLTAWPWLSVFMGCPTMHLVGQLVFPDFQSAQLTTKPVAKQFLTFAVPKPV
jgi:hypothetical protein